MKKASITEAKNRLSALIDQVRHGEPVLIVDRGTPVARLESALTTAGADPEGRLARLERQGVVRVARRPPSRRALAGAPPAPRKGASALAALLAERRQGR